ncbi:serine hydrolase domain-containing protein [Undibacterium sp. TJN19]|uniref:serine hydrolase domain-containing protein n=1 Tax=Undibacterium sp. TJN19 TaxID=3413055 RepID=UPI003BEF6EFC
MQLKFLMLSVSLCALLAACGGKSDSPIATTPAVVTQPVASILTGDTLRAEVERFRSSNGFPAISVTIVNQDKVEAVVTGNREINTNKTVLNTDFFQLGSLTKAVTATLIARLVEQNKIRWDSSVAEVFPTWRAQIRPEYLNVTVEQLLRHRSGLSRDIADETIENALPILTGDILADRRTVAMLMLKQAPEYTPNSKMVYSNIGYALAGLMAETAGGDSYENLMQKEVFGPLNMKAYFGFPDDKGVNNNAGHTLAAGKWIVTPPVTDLRYAYLINAAGGLNLSMADYGLFLREQLRGLQGKSTYLSKATFQLMHTPVDDYGMGWDIVNLPDFGTVSLHNGTERTYYASTAVVPDKNLAAAVTCNCFDESIMAKVDAFVNTLLTPVLPKT